MKFSALVEIRGLDGLADPEGRTIERALPALGFEGIDAVHVGKVIRLVLEREDEDAARADLRSLCDRLLANPVIERAEIWLGRAGEEEPHRAGTAGAGTAGPGTSPADDRIDVRTDMQPGTPR